MFEADHPLLLQGIIEQFELEDTLKDVLFQVPAMGYFPQDWDGQRLIQSGLGQWLCEAMQWERCWHCASEEQEPSVLGDGRNKALRHLHP